MCGEFQSIFVNSALLLSDRDCSWKLIFTRGENRLRHQCGIIPSWREEPGVRTDGSPLRYAANEVGLGGRVQNLDAKAN
jgi:hypothetical protein